MARYTEDIKVREERGQRTTRRARGRSASPRRTRQSVRIRDLAPYPAPPPLPEEPHLKVTYISNRTFTNAFHPDDLEINAQPGPFREAAPMTEGITTIMDNLGLTVEKILTLDIYL